MPSCFDFECGASLDGFDWDQYCIRSCILYVYCLALLCALLESCTNRGSFLLVCTVNLVLPETEIMKAKISVQGNFWEATPVQICTQFPVVRGISFEFFHGRKFISS